MNDFDPYYEWLGIPPDERPISHYRLLSLREFEANRSVINNAADARMAFIRGFQLGPRADYAVKLLNEIASASICLLNPAKKQAYDDELKAASLPRHNAPPVLPAGNAVAGNYFPPVPQATDDELGLAPDGEMPFEDLSPHSIRQAIQKQPPRVVVPTNLLDELEGSEFQPPLSANGPPLLVPKHPRKKPSSVKFWINAIALVSAPIIGISVGLAIVKYINGSGESEADASVANVEDEQPSPEPLSADGQPPNPVNPVRRQRLVDAAPQLAELATAISQRDMGRATDLATQLQARPLLPENRRELTYWSRTLFAVRPFWTYISAVMHTDKLRGVGFEIAGQPFVIESSNAETISAKQGKKLYEWPLAEMPLSLAIAIYHREHRPEDFNHKKVVGIVHCVDRYGDRIAGQVALLESVRVGVLPTDDRQWYLKRLASEAPVQIPPLARFARRVEPADDKPFGEKPVRKPLPQPEKPDLPLSIDLPKTDELEAVKLFDLPNDFKEIDCAAQAWFALPPLPDEKESRYVLTSEPNRNERDKRVTWSLIAGSNNEVLGRLRPDWQDPRSVARLVLRDGGIWFQWLENARGQRAGCLRYGLLHFKLDARRYAVQMFQPRKIPPIDISLASKKESIAIDLPDLPSGDGISWELVRVELDQPHKVNQPGLVPLSRAHLCEIQEHNLPDTEIRFTVRCQTMGNTSEIQIEPLLSMGDWKREVFCPDGFNDLRRDLNTRLQMQQRTQRQLQQKLSESQLRLAEAQGRILPGNQTARGIAAVEKNADIRRNAAKVRSAGERIASHEKGVHSFRANFDNLDQIARLHTRITPFQIHLRVVCQRDKQGIPVLIATDN